MKIDDGLILKLENLARLSLNPEERKSIQQDLEKILGLCEKLNEVDTDGVEPLRYLGAKAQTPRQDQVSKQLDAEKAMSNAPDRFENYFRVPKVIKENK